MRALFANTGQRLHESTGQRGARHGAENAAAAGFLRGLRGGQRRADRALLRADPKLARRLAFARLDRAALRRVRRQPAGDQAAARTAGGGDTRARNRFGNTPLQAALLTGQFDAAKLLIEGGADVNMRQTGGFVALHEAALTGRKDLVDLLLDHGAEIAARANDGRNAVSEAERGKHAELVGVPAHEEAASTRRSPRI